MADLRKMIGYEVGEEVLGGEYIRYVEINEEKFYLANQVARKLLGYSGVTGETISKRVSKGNFDKVMTKLYKTNTNVINLMGIYELATNSKRGSTELITELINRLKMSVLPGQKQRYSFQGKDLEIKKFDFNGFKISAFEIEGEPYFLGTEITNILGYKNPRDAIYRYVDGDDKLSVEILDGKFRGMPLRVAINEPGLYDLIRGSHLPGAERFKYWVSHEVLPSIRKTGGYSINRTPLTDENLRDQLLNPDTIIKIAQNWKEEQEKNKLLTEQNQMLEVEIKKTEPIVTYTNKVLKSKGLLTTTNVASSFGIKGHTSAIKFNELLQDLKIQYKRGKTWYLRNKFEGNDYTFHQETDNRGNECTPFMKWTQKGRLFLYEQLTKAGYKIRED